MKDIATRADLRGCEAFIQDFGLIALSRFGLHFCLIMSHSASHLYEPAIPLAAMAKSARRAPLVFDRQGVQAVDRAAIEEYGIPGIVLMENAARGLADHAMQLLARDAEQPLEHDRLQVLIICGSGNNGGDGYALARHLHNRDEPVLIAALEEPKAGSDASTNREICRKMKLRQIDIDRLLAMEDVGGIGLIVDAIFGTGLDRPVTGKAARVIDWINARKRPVLAVDVPSGLDCNSGRVLGKAVRATKTVTFVGLKTGFIGLDAQSLLGEVVVADIGAPVELLERFGRPSGLSHHEAPEHETSISAGPARPPNN